MIPNPAADQIKLIDTQSGVEKFRALSESGHAEVNAENGGSVEGSGSSGGGIQQTEVTETAGSKSASSVDAGSTAKSGGSNFWGGGGSHWGAGPSFGGGPQLAGGGGNLGAVVVVGAAGGMLHMAASSGDSDGHGNATDQRANNGPASTPPVTGMGPVLPPSTSDLPADITAAFDRIDAANAVIAQMEIIQTQARTAIVQAHSMMEQARTGAGRLAADIVRAHAGSDHSGAGVDVTYMQESFGEWEALGDVARSSITNAEDALAAAGLSIAQQLAIIRAAEAEIAAWSGAHGATGSDVGHGDHDDDGGDGGDDGGAGGSSSSTTTSGPTNTGHSGTGHGADVAGQMNGGAGNVSRPGNVRIISRLYMLPESSTAQSGGTTPDTADGAPQKIPPLRDLLDAWTHSMQPAMPESEAQHPAAHATQDTAMEQPAVAGADQPGDVHQDDANQTLLVIGSPALEPLP